MNNQEQDQFDFTQESSKMCLFEPRVFQIHKILQTNLRIVVQH